MCPYIQSEVDEKTHGSLEALARKRKISLKAVVREAVEEYIVNEAATDDVPFKDVLGTLDLPPGNWSERKNWRFPELD
jgi:hypothetical protein